MGVEKTYYDDGKAQSKEGQGYDKLQGVRDFLPVSMQDLLYGGQPGL